MRTIQLFVLIISALLLLSCENDNGPSSSGQFKIADYDAGLVPLAVGNRWTYIDSSFSNGQVSTFNTVLGISGTSNIQYQSQPYTVYHWNWLNPVTLEPGKIAWLMANGPEGVYDFGGRTAQGDTVMAKNLYVKFPARLGETWKRVEILNAGSYIILGDTLVVTVVSTNEVLDTPAGKIRCYVYSSQRGSLNVLEYYSVNMGYVALIQMFNGTITFKKVLSSYQIH